MQNNLTEVQQERYSRNITIKDIDLKGQEKLLNSRVLVAGCGGLGSTVISNLASLGIGHIGLIDNDKVELSNLNRQYIHKLSSVGKLKTDSAKNWIEEFNKDIDIKTFAIRLSKENYKEIFKDYDYVIDCFDSFQSKFLLNDAAIACNKILIHGGVSEFQGQVMTIIPNKTACLKCIFPEADSINYNVKGVVSPAVSTIASIESMELLKLILNTGEPLTNKILFYDGLATRFKLIDIKKNENCICSSGKH